jgi:hypothetical protein
MTNTLNRASSGTIAVLIWKQGIMCKVRGENNGFTGSPWLDRSDKDDGCIHAERRSVCD